MFRFKRNQVVQHFFLPFGEGHGCLQCFAFRNPSCRGNGRLLKRAPVYFSTATLGEKKAKCQPPFFYFSSLCFLNPGWDLLYIFSDAEALSFRSRRRGLHRISQRRPYYFLCFACPRRSLQRVI